MMYIALFLLSLTLTYFIKNYAIKKSLVAAVNDRSSHTVPTPHGGGIAIAVTWFVGLGVLYALDQIESKLFYALLVGAVISIVSFFDDLFELSPVLRLSVQGAVAAAGLYALGGLDTVDLFFFEMTHPILTNIFAFLLIVWFINLYNFLDGIDGYAGSEALFLALAGGLLFGGDHFGILAASVGGFLVWNWHKAKIFMGDVGSTLLGYTVAVFTIYYANQESTYLWVWIGLFGLFWMDATITLVRRKLSGEKLSQAHRKHAYQRLAQAGWSHDRVVLAGMGINGVVGLFFYSLNPYMAFIISIALLYSFIKYIDSKKGFH